MKFFYFAISIHIVFALSSQVYSRGLLGSSECTWGPSYWCSNITNAKNCNAVHHCIQTVWEKQTITEDNDSICQICLDMVKQARDQLQSNETESDIKDVFEGSCKLIPLKAISKECVKLVDNFAPELVEALASQMNPQVVCSVAGLCNNAEIDKMLKDITETESNPITTPDYLQSKTEKIMSCNECTKVGSKIVENFKKTSRDDFLESMLHLCGLFSSYSDACSSILLTNFDTIYSKIQKDISVKNICHLSGVCAEIFYHNHGKPVQTIDITPLSSIGVVSHVESSQNDDDVPCKLCEQLVRHLRDVLVANTTESEFKQVLEGFCKQTKSFKDECLGIVDQYYDVIYNTLVNNVDPNGTCFMIGVCPKGSSIFNSENRPIMPLLPSKLKYKNIEKTKLLGENEPIYSQRQIQEMQLPIDKLMGAPNSKDLVENGELCTICEYFLHFVQEALATPANEDKIKEIVSSTCSRLPTSIEDQCHNFVDMYGDAIIALLIQDIDPSTICPKLKLCPQNIVNDMEVFIPNTIKVNVNTKTEKPTCALCLLAVAQAEQMIKADKSEEHIQEVLDNLCSHIKGKLNQECVDFVNAYSSQLIEKLVKNFKPQEICEYIKLCSESLIDININLFDESEHEIMTNEILDKTVNGIDKSNNLGNIECTLCKEIVKRTENHLVNTNKTRQTIISILEESCEMIHQIKNKCHSYVNKYGDKIAELILQEISPEDICSDILLCTTEQDSLNIDDNLSVIIISKPIYEVEDPNDEIEEITGEQCVICEFVMAKLESELKNKKTQEEIKNTIHKVCSKIPKTVRQNCNDFVNKYGDLLIALVDTVPPKEICSRINLCMTQKFHIDANEEIIECGVCHGAALALSSLIKENPDISDEDMILEGCNKMHAKYHEKCSDLIAFYGESIMNMIKQSYELSAICKNIGKCFYNENSLESYLKIGGYIDIDRKKRSPNTSNLIVGAQKCTWGPSYWCENTKQADECNAKNWCVTKKLGFAAV